MTPSEVQAEYHRKNDKVKVDYVAWTPKDLRSQVSVTPDEMKVFYEQNKHEFLTPESGPSICLSPTKRKSAPLSMFSEGDLRAAYNQNLDRLPDSGEGEGPAHPYQDER